MKTKITAALLALMLSPGLALAMGCGDGHKDVTVSACAEGSSFDATLGTCIPTPTT